MASPDSGSPSDRARDIVARTVAYCALSLVSGVGVGAVGYAHLGAVAVVSVPVGEIRDAGFPDQGPIDAGADGGVSLCACAGKQNVLKAISDTTPKLKSLGEWLEPLRKQCPPLVPGSDGGVVAGSSGGGASLGPAAALASAEPAALDSLRRMHKSHLECIDQANACKSGIDQYEKTFEKMAREIGPESDSEKLKVKQVINYLEQTTDAMEKHYLDISASIRLDIGTAIDKSGRERYSIEAQIAKHRLLQSPEKTAYYMAAKSLRVLQGLQRGLRAGLEPVGGAGRDAVELARHDRERLDKSFAVALNTLSQAKAVPAPTQPPSKLSDSSQLCQLVGTLEQAQLAELQRSLASLADDLARLPTQQSTVTVGAHQ